MIKVEDAISLVETIGKYSWTVSVGIAFVLFAPNEAANQIGILDIRKAYLGYLWVGLVMSISVWAVAVFRYVDVKVEGHFLRKRLRREKYEKEEARKALFVQRLSSLSDEEEMWIKYCLFHNQQTLNAERTRSFAQSLVNKGILTEGSGSILNLPFHVKDEVWLYIRENKEKFLSVEEENSQAFLQRLNRFHSSLVRRRG